MSSCSLPSGFMVSDYILSFEIADPQRHAQLEALCERDWDGERLTQGLWELNSPLGPHELEDVIVPLLGTSDRAVYYYLTPPIASAVAGKARAKRIFRVVLGGEQQG